jgi:tRNA U34 2-thiouridine synthase MnmA/TrmU
MKLEKKIKKVRKPKALVLLSGGLDSRLVVKMLEEQLGRRHVEAVFFALPFGGGCCSDRFCVLKFTSSQNIKLHVVDCTKGRMLKRYMAIVKKPKYPRGVGMNPCIDCHLFMLKTAKRLAKRAGADIIATGEVLGERPLSQNKGALALIERKAGLDGKVLRPLSAKALPETEAERNGWIDRKQLKKIVGRRRVEQIRLAKKYRIDFPMPGGGCWLTEKQFSKRLKNMLEYKSKAEPGIHELGLLSVGRHFKSGKRKKSIIIVGRNEKENDLIATLAKRIKPSPSIMEAEGVMGPTTAVLNPSRPAIQLAARLTVRYADAPKRKPTIVLVKTGSKTRKMQAKALPKREIEKMRV